MMMSATPFLKTASLIAGAALIASAAVSPAQAQVQPEVDAREVGMTPLRDLNLDPRDVPPLLTSAAADPYATKGLAQCSAIVTEIAALDDVLGADYDIAEANARRGRDNARIAQSVVGAIIPFRGVLREVTGAADKDRELQAAYTGGMVRRAFLKGWGLGRGCRYPARPKLR